MKSKLFQLKAQASYPAAQPSVRSLMNAPNALVVVLSIIAAAVVSGYFALRASQSEQAAESISVTATAAAMSIRTTLVTAPPVEVTRLVEVTSLSPTALSGGQKPISTVEASTTISSLQNIWQEDFTKEVKYWPILEPHDTGGGTDSSRHEDNAFIWSTKIITYVAATLLSKIPVISNFKLETDLKMREGLPSAYYGIAFRESSYGYYRFMINNEGKCLVQKWTLAKGEYNDIVTPNNCFINIQGTNTLKIEAQNTTLKFSINDKLIGQLYDDSFRSGTISLHASGLELNKSFVLVMSTFKLSLLEN